MQSMLDMIESYTSGAPEPPPLFPRVTYKIYWNTYGGSFTDTNNISLVTFLTCGDVKFIIPGDVEQNGWEGLLAQQGFSAELSEVDIFVASHHGRENGYSREVMNIAQPSVVVCSDSPVVHSTQEMANTYGRHCSGIMFNGSERKVLSTRNDGTFTWTL